MTNTNTSKMVNIEFNEKILEVDYQENLKQIFVSFLQLQRELKYETQQEKFITLHSRDYLKVLSKMLRSLKGFKITALIVFVSLQSLKDSIKLFKKSNNK